MLSHTLAATALLAGLARAHMSIFHPSMYGFPPQYEDTALWPTGYDPVAPLGPSWDLDDWWFRGTAVQKMAPAKGQVATLPAGGDITLEIACNVAWTDYGYSMTNVACPGNVGAYHAGDPAADEVDESLVSGCALAIADVDDISKVTWDNLVVFSVQEKCVWEVNTTFSVPSAMPECTGDHCICGWFWLANNGTGNSYMTGFNCDVTRPAATATEAKAIGPVHDPAYCPDPTDCQAGAKRPIYMYQNEFNVEWIDNYHRPSFAHHWSFSDGPQDDIFLQAPSVPSPDIALGSTNLALKATASASSSADGQAASGANDGTVKGYTAYTGDTYDSNEWASYNEGAGAWLRLTWDAPQWVARVVLYDRPNQMDRVKGATLTFSDGTTVTVTDLVNDASFGTYVDLSAPVYTSYVHVTITSVSQTTSSVGLSEVQVYGPASTSGLTAPVNLASGGVATASSYSSPSTPAGAIDGKFGGYTDAAGDATDSQEWSSDGQGKGAWLKVVLPTAGTTVNKVVLSDRPNSNDWVKSGTLSFSDGSSVSVGVLPNDGASYAVTFSARAVDWVMFTVKSVASTTSNVGLSELQVFNSNGANVTVVSSTKTATSSVVSASTVTKTTATSATTSAIITSAIAPSTTTSTTTTTRSTTTTTTTTRATTTTAGGLLGGALNSIAASLSKANSIASAKASSLASVQSSKAASLASKASASASKAAASRSSKLASASKAAASKASAAAASASKKSASLAKAKSIKAAQQSKKKTTTTTKKKATTTKKIAAIKSVTIKAANSAASAAKSKSSSLSKSRSLSKSKSLSKSRSLSLAKSKSLAKAKAAAKSKAAKGHKRYVRRAEQDEDEVEEPAATVAADEAEENEGGEWDFEVYEPAKVDLFNAAAVLAHPFVVIPDDEAEGGPKEEAERRERRRRQAVRE